MKKSKLIAIPAIGAAGAGLGAGIFFEELYRYVFHRHGYSIFFPVDKGDHPEEYVAARDAAEAALREIPAKEYSITSVRGNTLNGYYYQWGEVPSKTKVFIIHGYRSEHLQTAGLFAEHYRARGIDMFCCDHEAHGKSKGSVIGYDYYESADCLRWIDFLQQEFGPDIQLFLQGFSMGGGTVLKMSNRVPDCVKFIIDDCGFSSAAEILRPLTGPLFTPLNRMNHRIGGYSLGDTDVRPNLLQARVPILFVHGTLDKTVPFAMGEELYALCPTRKDKLFVEGAKHVECIWKAPEAYFEKVDEFIQKYMD